MLNPALTNWPSARLYTEAIQCPALCFADAQLRETLPAVDRLGMPLVTSGQFAYVFKLNRADGGAFAARCFRAALNDRAARYAAIDAHLSQHAIAALPSFAYNAQGILVAGRRLPLLVMEWIHGPTLDVYLEEVVGRREIMLHLAEEWLRLVNDLRAGGVAHGDLQHGNIIVESGRLRLVDLDGMYVPAMQGWTASEVGHQHYQHPKRDERFFNEDLDNFSTLVIYLSLIALAERPALWAEHHDENLLFTKKDFQDPSASALFAKIKSIGAEHRRLGEVLEKAARGTLADVPGLTSLVQLKRTLPAWMTPPPDLAVTGRTREVAPPKAASGKGADAAWSPWQMGAARSPRRMPETPGSVAVQSLFSAPPQTQTHAAPVANATPRDPADIARNALMYAKLPVRASLPFVWLWFIGLRSLFSILGEYGALIMLLLMTMACLIYGFTRAVIEAQKALKSASSSSKAHFVAGAPARRQPLSNWVGQSALAAAPPNQTATPSSAHVIGNQRLGIYHEPDCTWAKKITPSNRVSFASTQMAQAASFRPCRICRP